MKKNLNQLIRATFLSALLFPFAGFADPQSFEISIKDHKYSPETITVKANEKFYLLIKNQDATSEEFESKMFIIEKFLGPHQSARVILGPLKPGTYAFYGEFHMDTAKGQIIAK